MIDSERPLTHIANMQWFVLDAWVPGNLLLTSNRPLIMTDGLANDNSHIVMPISPTLLFVAVNNDKTWKQILRKQRDEIVRLNNRLVSEQARKFVYGFSGAAINTVSSYLGKAAPSSPFDTMKF